MEHDMRYSPKNECDMLGKGREGAGVIYVVDVLLDAVCHAVKSLEMLFVLLQYARL